MAENDVRNRNNRHVDDAGIRLAPPPMHSAAYHVMPSVVQEYVIQPHIEIEQPE